MNVKFGNRLKKARKSKNLTQKQLAESIGINQKQYQHWERGRAEPSFDKVKRLSYVLEADIEWLLYGSGKLITNNGFSDNINIGYRDMKARKKHMEILDTKGLKCPEPLLKIAVKSVDMNEGDILEVIGDCPTFGNDVNIWCKRLHKNLLFTKIINL